MPIRTLDWKRCPVHRSDDICHQDSLLALSIYLGLLFLVVYNIARLSLSFGDGLLKVPDDDAVAASLLPLVIATFFPIGMSLLTIPYPESCTIYRA